MVITFYRSGFASNSSSSHSIIFSNNNIIADEFYAASVAEFGWNNFTCKSRSAKERYLFLTLLSNIEYNERTAYTRVVCEHLKDVFNDIDKTIKQTKDGYIDHQSVITIPKDYQNPEYPSMDFFKDLYRELIERDYVILGGNDNDDRMHHFIQYHENNDDTNKIIEILTKFSYYDDLFCVKDPNTKEWTISDIASGTIFKMLFHHDLHHVVKSKNLFDDVADDTISKLKFKKSTYPYLVDIKITDKCSYNCGFCYQSSTKHGKHADTDFIINNIIPELKTANVFEVVLGGGEPTTHPDLNKIVKAFKRNKFKISLTTKNYNIGSTKKEIDVLENIHSLAFSANTVSELYIVAAQIEKLNFQIYNNIKYYVQSILGVTERLKNFISTAASKNIENITFLGYKNVGRGSSYTTNPFITQYSEWIDLIQKYSKSPFYINFGIDSVLVKDFKSELEHAGVSSKLLVDSDGKSTCYVDAVNKIVNASSFTNKEPTHYNFDQNNFLNIFKTF